eukprot:Opistho-2@58484
MKKATPSRASPPSTPLPQEADVPDRGVVYTFGKTRFNNNIAGRFWMKDDEVVFAACGETHSAVVTAKGRLYTFGANEWGQLGLGHKKTVVKPTVVKALKHEKVIHVACGRHHTLVATDSGKLYTFGAGGDHQLGHGDEEDQVLPKEIESLEAQAYSMVSCGAYHCAALTEEGVVLVWGTGSEGQLGTGTEECKRPTEIDGFAKGAWISCGYYHTALVNNKGQLFTFGEGDQGKLGHGDMNECPRPKRVEGIKTKVVAVSCGGTHTAALTDKGVLYTFGSGQFGQIGQHSGVVELAEPRIVPALDGKKVKMVSCGSEHTGVVLESGEILTFGEGRHGKLGHGDENFSNVSVPKRIESLSKVLSVGVACGGCQTLVLGWKKTAKGNDRRTSSPVKRSFSSEHVPSDRRGLGDRGMDSDFERGTGRKLAPLPPLKGGRLDAIAVKGRKIDNDRSDHFKPGELKAATSKQKKKKGSDTSDFSDSDSEVDLRKKVPKTPASSDEDGPKHKKKGAHSDSETEGDSGSDSEDDHRGKKAGTSQKGKRKGSDEGSDDDKGKGKKGKEDAKKGKGKDAKDKDGKEKKKSSMCTVL